MVAGELDGGGAEAVGEGLGGAVGKLALGRFAEADHDAGRGGPQGVDVGAVVRGGAEQVSEEHLGVGDGAAAAAEDLGRATGERE